jgi:hypothetical protein
MPPGGKGSAPTTVAEGLGDVLRAVVACMQAPDAVHYAGPLMKLQTSVLDMVHGQLKGGQQGQPQGPPPGGMPGGPPPGMPPGGPGGARPPSPLMGGLAGLQGAGPPPPPTTSGVDAESLRQDALAGSEQ